MSVVLVTGSAGLVGSETVRFFCEKKFDVIGIDNNMRREFFGDDSSTEWMRLLLEKSYANYTHCDADIRDNNGIKETFKKYGRDISLIVHTAAQPSHDWAATDPFKDFSVNAVGTQVMLENYRKYAPEAVFIFTSTNKVYGDLPNKLPLVELETRFEIDPDNRWQQGIDETMSIDRSMHSLFGASKVAADVLVQEYGRYFGLKTACFRGGCLTGPAHSGTKLHGFLSYLVRCVITGKKYEIYGYKGKQVRDNIHSSDLINAFYHFYQKPRSGEVYNIGGGRFSNISMLEAIELSMQITGKKLYFEYIDRNRAGDHIWWISGMDKFKKHYPEWKQAYDSELIIREIYEMQKSVLQDSVA
ncbi:MAG: NAD-dependent epimerase/dehydratase family protein [Deltaproteobacteria bacterium]|nr:NAD-dependent epimerase/dehydratase family protein [Deltaproteobacteria bacterium]